MKKISIIIPCFNEEKTILKIIESVYKQKLNNKKFEYEIIVINDGSNDSSYERLLTFRSKIDLLINHNYNMGKGAAVKSGLKKCSGDIILIQDSDLEYNPENYSQLLQPFENENIHVVYGSRFLNKKKFILEKGINYNFRKSVNLILTKFYNIIYNQNLTDVHTGYKLFRSHVLKDIFLKENDFALCAEVSAKVAKKKINIYEVEIDFSPRSYHDGKQIKNIDGVKAIIAYLKYWF